MLVCRKALGMLVTLTCLPTLASIVHVIIMASKDIVGEHFSAFVVYSRCDLPSAHPLDLIAMAQFFEEH